MGKGNAGEDGKGFSKTDMERMGIFHEMGYITIGDNYKGSRFCKYQKHSVSAVADCNLVIYELRVQSCYQSNE